MTRIRLDPKERNPETTEPEDEGSEKYEQIIYVGPDWRLAFDGLQYVAQKRLVRDKGAKAGKAYWRNEAYIRFFGDALMWLARRRIYTVPGTFGPEALTVLNDALLTIKEEIRASMSDFMRKQIKVPK